jgi:hypothetical protein
LNSIPVKSPKDWEIGWDVQCNYQEFKNYNVKGVRKHETFLMPPMSYKGIQWDISV